jgi:hypothetical protein
MASTIKVDQIEGSTGSTITVPTGQTFTIADGVPVASGGTGIASFAAGDVLYATGSTTLAKLTKGAAEKVLSMNSGGALPEWTDVDLTVLPTITAVKGGTGQTGFAAGDILYANSTTTLTKLVKGSAADVLTMNAGATAPEWAASAGGGKLLQLVTTFKSDTWSGSVGTDTWSSLITGLTVSIQPSAADSSVLILWNVGNFCLSAGGGITGQLLRDTTPIGVGAASGSRAQAVWGMHPGVDTSYGGNAAGMFLDVTPGTSTYVYGMKVGHTSSTGKTLYINQTGTTTDDFRYPRTGSNITAIEIGA